MQLLPPLTRDRAGGRTREAGRASSALCAARRRSHDRDARRPADAGDPPARPAVRDRRHRRDQLPQARCATRCCRRSARRASRSITMSSAARSMPSLTGDFPDAFSRQLDAAWRARLAAQEALRQRPVPDPGPPAAAGPGRDRLDRLRGWLGRAGDDRRRAGDATSCASSTPRATRCSRRSAATAAPARRLRDAAAGLCSEPLEFLSALYNGEMRPVLLPHAGSRRTICPIAGSASAQDTVELGAGRARRRAASSAWSRSRIIRRRPRPACSTTAAPAVRDDRLAELRLRRPPGGAGADEPGAAPDARGRGRGAQPARRTGQRQGRCRRRPRRLRRASHDHRGPRPTRRPRSTTASPKCRRRWPIPASSRCARTSSWSRPSGRSSRATSNISRGAA